MPQFVQHPWINPGAIEQRDYQEAIVKTALSGNTLCVLPTGLGKTALAALVAAERLKRSFESSKQNKEKAAAQKSPGFVSADSIKQEEDAKVLFLAPTRPLVDQHRNTFEKFLKIGPSELIVVTGETKPLDRKKLYKQAWIVFSTPQTARNDVKNGILELRDFNLLIVDEAHRTVGAYANVAVAKRYKQEARHPLILALTASPGASGWRIDQIKKSLGIENVEIRGREDGDVKEYVQPLDEKWIDVLLPPELMQLRALFEACRNSRFARLQELNIPAHPKMFKRELLALQQRLGRSHGYAALSVVAEILKIDHAILLAETQCLYALQKYMERLKEDSTLAASRLLKDESIVRASIALKKFLDGGVENPKLMQLKIIAKSELAANRRLLIFTQYRDTVDAIIASLSNIPNSKALPFIGQANKTKGDAKMSSAAAGMSQEDQQNILRRFKSGDANVLVATSIGEEGLDIAETDTVIFFEPIPSEIRTIQRAGRTARTRPGRVIMLKAKGTRDEAFYWAAKNKERKMKSILYGMRQKNPGALWAYR
jgi:Fanconi anemia group M protein